MVSEKAASLTKTGGLYSDFLRVSGFSTWIWMQQSISEISLLIWSANTCGSEIEIL